MRDTTVYCSMSGCENAATIKIAAPWKYGHFSELKTYGYACDACAPEALARVQAQRGKLVNLAPGEFLGEIGTYEIFKG